MALVRSLVFEQGASLFDKQWQYGYHQAIALSAQQLAGADIAGLCQRSGARHKATGPQKGIWLDYLGRTYRITYPEAGVSLVGSDEEVTIKDRVLILHYLLSAKGTPATGRTVTFREVPDGGNYFDVFQKRAIKPFLDRFGTEPEGMVITARKLGGREANYGDAAVTFDAFPRVLLTFVLWRGDEEFPAQGSVLFDASVSDYLSSYALTELCEGIVWKLVRLSKT